MLYVPPWPTTARTGQQLAPQRGRVAAHTGGARGAPDRAAEGGQSERKKERARREERTERKRTNQRERPRRERPGPAAGETQPGEETESEHEATLAKEASRGQG